VTGTSLTAKMSVVSPMPPPQSRTCAPRARAAWTAVSRICLLLDVGAVPFGVLEAVQLAERLVQRLAVGFGARVGGDPEAVALVAGARHARHHLGDRDVEELGEVVGEGGGDVGVAGRHGVGPAASRRD